MQKRIFPFLFLSLLINFNAFSQVVTGDEKEVDNYTEETEVEVKEPREMDSVTQLYFNANWSNTFRSLTPNGDLFGEELGVREDETSANFWSYSLGLRNQLGKHFLFEVGLGLVRNGEKYAYSEILTDSAFSYTTKYTFISMPIVAYYTYGKEIKLMAGAGIVPQLFMSQVQDQNITTANNTKSKEEVKVKSGTPEHTSFTSSAVFRIGVQLQYSPFWSIYVMPEYRMQLGSTYGKTSPYLHKATAIGFNLGLTYQL